MRACECSNFRSLDKMCQCLFVCLFRGLVYIYNFYCSLRSNSFVSCICSHSLISLHFTVSISSLPFSRLLSIYSSFILSSLPPCLPFSTPLHFLFLPLFHSTPLPLPSPSFAPSSGQARPPFPPSAAPLCIGPAAQRRQRAREGSDATHLRPPIKLPERRKSERNIDHGTNC